MERETDNFSTAQNEYQMQIETDMLVSIASLGWSAKSKILIVLSEIQISKAEEMLSLTRGMKELWLRGHLDTLGKGTKEDKMGEDVKAVAALLEKMVKARDESVAEADA